MKKGISLLLAVLVFASLTVLPAFAETINLAEPKFSCDFEEFESTDDKFFDEEKPANFPFFVGGVEGGGITIVEDGVGGTKSITAFRIAGSHESTNLRVSGIDTAYAEGTKYVAAQFAFKIEKIGDYGFTAIVGNEGLDIEAWQPNFLSVKTANGEIVVNGFNNGVETVAKTGLEANKDYVLTAVFELGTKKYDLYLDGEKIGSFENGVGNNGAALNGIGAFRIDHHGMDTPENLLDIVYFDDFKIAAVSTGAAENPGGSDNNDPSTPNTPTGDSMSLVVVVAMAAILATVLLKKRENA